MKKTKPFISFAVASLLAASSFHAAIAAEQPKSPPIMGSTADQVGEPSAEPKKGFWERDALTGDWGGLRTRIEDKGVTFSAIYTAEVFGNWGGADESVISDGLFNAGLDIDLDKLTGFWKEAAIHANMLYIYGPSLSEKYIGDLGNISNIAGYNSVRLQELWFEQGFFDKRFSLRAGMIAADANFFISDSACLFINGSFGANPLIAVNFANAPVYPIANPGVLLNIAPVQEFYLKAAVFGMNARIPIRPATTRTALIGTSTKATGRCSCLNSVICSIRSPIPKASSEAIKSAHSSRTDSTRRGSRSPTTRSASAASLPPAPTTRFTA